jgi:hypothetical protein
MEKVQNLKSSNTAASSKTFRDEDKGCINSATKLQNCVSGMCDTWASGQQQPALPAHGRQIYRTCDRVLCGEIHVYKTGFICWTHEMKDTPSYNECTGMESTVCRDRRAPNIRLLWPLTAQIRLKLWISIPEVRGLNLDRANDFPGRRFPWFS